MKCIVLLVALFFCTNVYVMESDQLAESVDWAYMSLKGCSSCGVPIPSIPQIKTVALSVKNKSDLRSFLNDPSHKTLLCRHSGLGIYRALSSFNTKKNEKNFDNVIKDNRLYKGPLGGKYVVDDEIVGAYPWLNVKRCLFVGNNPVFGSGRYGKSAAQELSKFFSAAIHNQFDVCEVISERWTDECIADIYQATVDSGCIHEECAPSSFEAISALFTKSNGLSSYAISHDGSAYVIGLGKGEDNLFLYKNSVSHGTSLIGHCDPIGKVLFSKNDAIIVSTSVGAFYNCIVWDAVTGLRKITVSCPQDTISSFAASADGGLIALFGGYGNSDLKTLNVWSSEEDELIACIDDKTIPDLMSLEFSPDKRWLIGKVAHKLHDLLLWRIDTQNKRLVPIAQYGAFSACAFFPKMKLAAFTDYEGHIYIVRADDDSERVVIKEFIGGIVRTLVFDPLGNNVLCARVYENGVVYSSWNMLTQYKKDFFLIPSLNNAPATEFTSITFNDSANKLLLGASNFFVFGDWIKRRR